MSSKLKTKSHALSSQKEPSSHLRAPRARASQQALFQMWNRDRFAFGGSKLKRSHAKSSRPFSRKLPIHIILKSSEARGSQSLLRHFSAINEIVFEEASRQHLKLLGAANAGNHLHLLVQAPSKEYLSAFLRAVSGRIAMRVTGARKGSPHARKSQIQNTVGSTITHTESQRAPFGDRRARIEGRRGASLDQRARFWDQRPFTRIVAAGRDTLNVLQYLTLNSTESLGLSRAHVRLMFAELRQATARGLLIRAPRLAATGFT